MKLMIISISLVCIYVSLPSSVLPEEVDGGGLGLMCTGKAGDSTCSFKGGVQGMCGYGITDILVGTNGRRTHKSPETKKWNCNSTYCVEREYPRAHEICNKWGVDVIEI